MIKAIILFQNYVILDSNKTENESGIAAVEFQNYVILDSNKTSAIKYPPQITVLELCYFRQ